MVTRFLCVYAQILATFSEPRRFYRHLQGLSSTSQRELIRMLVRFVCVPLLRRSAHVFVLTPCCHTQLWLLRRRCLVQLQTYVDVLLPAKPLRERDTGTGQHPPTLASDRSSIESNEQFMVFVRHNIPAESWRYTLLARLLPYAVCRSHCNASCGW